MKKDKGITLIALVVTIIVLLILAAVTISLLIGKNGIISKAEDAKHNTIAAQEEENKILNEYANKIDEYTGNKSNGGDNENENNKPLAPDYQENADIIEPINDWKKVETITSPGYNSDYANYLNLRDKKTNTFASNVAGVKLIFTDLFVERDEYVRFDKVTIENKYSEQIVSMCGKANSSTAMPTARSSVTVKGNFYKLVYLTDFANAYRGYSCDVYITTNEELVKEDDKPITQYNYDRTTRIPMHFNGFDKEKEVYECTIAEGEGNIPLEFTIGYVLPKLDGETDFEWSNRAKSLKDKFRCRIEIYSSNAELLYEKEIITDSEAFGYNAFSTTLDGTNVSGKIRIEITKDLSLSSQYMTVIVGGT